MARLVFFGSPDFAIPSLEALLFTPYRPSLVVTQPDRPSGRGKSLRPTPVREFAERNGIEITVVESLKGERTPGLFRSFEPDFFVVVAFGLILPQRILRIPKRGNINVHASLLPEYRGASPINAAIVHGDTVTGVTTMEMVKELDAGPVYLRREVSIGLNETAGELSERLAATGAALLVETLERIESEGLAARPQPERGASYAPRLKKQEGLIPWSRDALSVHNHIRGMQPWPGSFTYLRGRYIKVHRAGLCETIPAGASPGTVLETGDEGVVVSCGVGTVRLTRLQMEGKRPLEAGEFLRGAALKPGDSFD